MPPGRQGAARAQRSNEEQARLSKWTATICTDVDVDTSLLGCSTTTRRRCASRSEASSPVPVEPITRTQVQSAGAARSAANRAAERRSRGSLDAPVRRRRGAARSRGWIGGGAHGGGRRPAPATSQHHARAGRFDVAYYLPVWRCELDVPILPASRSGPHGCLSGERRVRPQPQAARLAAAQRGIAVRCTAPPPYLTTTGSRSRHSGCCAHDLCALRVGRGSSLLGTGHFWSRRTSQAAAPLRHLDQADQSGGAGEGDGAPPELAGLHDDAGWCRFSAVKMRGIACDCESAGCGTDTGCGGIDEGEAPAGCAFTPRATQQLARLTLRSQLPAGGANNLEHAPARRHLGPSTSSSNSSSSRS